MIGRKAQIEDFGEFLLAGIVIAVLVFIAFFFISQDVRIQMEDFEKELAMIEASYTTRMILQHEIEPGYKVYNLVIDSVNNGSTTDINNALYKIKDVVEENYDSSVSSQWFFRINNQVIFANVAQRPYGAVQALTPIIIPNPEGENINVTFRRISDADSKFKYEQVIDIPLIVP